ncbi:MAG: hypothetical protein ACI4S3_00525 [Candidatus Gastranaerophilaceae bacterium]
MRENGMQVSGNHNYSDVGIKKNKFKEFIEETTNTASAAAQYATKVLPSLLSGNGTSSDTSSSSSLSYRG